MSELECREVVLTEDLEPLLVQVLEKRRKIIEAETGAAFPGLPTEQLSEQSGVPVRRIYGILNGETMAVDLDVADRLLMALGLFVELELPDAIYPAEEIRRATLDQSEFLWTWARCRGLYVPAKGTRGRHNAPQEFRRIAWRDRRRAA